MLLVLETPEEEAAILKGTVTALGLDTLIKSNKLSPDIRVAVKTKESD